MRERIRIVLSAAGKTPHPPEPIRVCLALMIDPPGMSLEERLGLLRERFPVGATAEISGLLWASPLPAPPLFAGGAYGAMVDLRLEDGALLVREEDEIGLLLPMDCRCRVEEEPSMMRFEVDEGMALLRPCVRLAQLDSFS